MDWIDEKAVRADGTTATESVPVRLSSGGRDLTGQRFGLLLVLYPTDVRADHGSIVWHCRCDCGNEAEVSSRRLVRGQVRSCGCLSSKPPMDYTGMRFGKLAVMGFAGNARDVGKAGRKRYWNCRCDCGNEVIVGQAELHNGDAQSCGCLQKSIVRRNLKLSEGSSVTILEALRDKLRSSNTSGCTGVYQERDGKWGAYINLQKKRYRLGRYTEKEDAIRARKRAEEMHEAFIEEYYRKHPERAKQKSREEP